MPLPMACHGYMAFRLLQPPMQGCAFQSKLSEHTAWSSHLCTSERFLVSRIVACRVRLVDSPAIACKRGFVSFKPHTASVTPTNRGLFDSRKALKFFENPCRTAWIFVIRWAVVPHLAHHVWDAPHKLGRGRIRETGLPVSRVKQKWEWLWVSDPIPAFPSAGCPPKCSEQKGHSFNGQADFGAQLMLSALCWHALGHATQRWEAGLFHTAYGGKCQDKPRWHVFWQFSCNLKKTTMPWMKLTNSFVKLNFFFYLYLWAKFKELHYTAYCAPFCDGYIYERKMFLPRLYFRKSRK